MRLNGIHHVTAITGDAQSNVDFYVGVLGLRLVKKSVNQDDPTVYHLFYGDEHAQPGADLTFFEYPGARPGRPGAGMVHRVIWRVRDEAAIDFWRDRLTAHDIDVEGLDTGRLLFADPEGLAHELTTHDDGNEPLAASYHEIPPEHALLGFAGVRAYTADPLASERFLVEGLNFEVVGKGSYRVAGDRRSSTYDFDTTTQRGVRGAGTVHHVAWWAADDEHERWREPVQQVGGHPTPVIDRHYFRSIYFTEPSGVLFELATESPGFTVDEPLEHLGEGLSLPPPFEPLRDELNRVLRPLRDPRVEHARS